MFLAEILWLKLVVSHAIVKKYDELRVFVGYLSNTKLERPIQHIKNTLWTSVNECKPIFHHEKNILHRTRRAQGNNEVERHRLLKAARRVNSEEYINCNRIYKIKFTLRSDLPRHLWW